MLFITFGFFVLPAIFGRLLLEKSEEPRQLRHSSKNKKDNFCSSPVSKAPVNFPDSLIGRGKVNYEMYSGYVNISTTPDYLFYWFFSSQDGNQDAPLVIWTNGGPGCSSMEGATTENGPLSLFEIKESCTGTTEKASATCDYTSQLSSNAYGWNAHANVLYLDQPKNVGYSFGYSLTGTKSSVESADEFIVFYNNWLQLFPEFIGRKLIIAGESYGGHYIPAWSNAILNYNSQAPSPTTPINYVGAIIGNGCVNNTVQDNTQFVKFQHAENLIPATSNPATSATARAAMNAYLGYTPNYYDYRVQSVSCAACYGYNYTAWSYWLLKSEVLTALNVCGDAGNDAFSGSAGGCISMGSFDANDKFDYSGALARTLEAGVPVTLYYGKTDTACNYMGGLQMANTIEWSGKSSFQSTPLSALSIGGVEAGQMKTYQGLTFIQVDNAGHMVPLNQPPASATVMQIALSNIAKSTV